MAKRGRPPKNGAQPAWMLHRMFMVLYAYNQARSAGNKHSSAVTEAVAWMGQNFPGRPVSETVVKRIVAELQPRGVPIAWQVSSLSEAEVAQASLEQQALEIPGAEKIKAGFSFGFGRRPEYPRHNAKSQ